jgi:hypothetical protein
MLISTVLVELNQSLGVYRNKVDQRPANMNMVVTMLVGGE